MTTPQKEKFKQERRDFPKVLREMRIELNETQEEFGRRFGVSHAAVSYWESGEDEMPYEVIYMLQDETIDLCFAQMEKEIVNIAAKGFTIGHKQVDKDDNYYITLEQFEYLLKSLKDQEALPVEKEV